MDLCGRASIAAEVRQYLDEVGQRIFVVGRQDRTKAEALAKQLGRVLMDLEALDPEIGNEGDVARLQGEYARLRRRLDAILPQSSGQPIIRVRRTVPDAIAPPNDAILRHGSSWVVRVGSKVRSIGDRSRLADAVRSLPAFATNDLDLWRESLLPHLLPNRAALPARDLNVYLTDECDA